MEKKWPKIKIPIIQKKQHHVEELNESFPSMQTTPQMESGCEIYGHLKFPANKENWQSLYSAYVNMLSW
jgi:hypothetical protein